MSKLLELLKYVQCTFGMDYIMSSVVKDDVCYQYVTLQIPCVEYRKTLKVFSYISDDYQTLNDDKMYKKLLALFPEDNSAFEKQLEILVTITKVRGNIFKCLKDIDDDKSLHNSDTALESIHTVNNHTYLKSDSLSEIYKVFEKVK